MSSAALIIHYSTGSRRTHYSLLIINYSLLNNEQCIWIPNSGYAPHRYGLMSARTFRPAAGSRTLLPSLYRLRGVHGDMQRRTIRSFQHPPCPYSPLSRAHTRPAGAAGPMHALRKMRAYLSPRSEHAGFDNQHEGNMRRTRGRGQPCGSPLKNRKHTKK